VPEPSTLALAGMGVLGLLGYLWRKRRSSAA
jgi:LPXTG-motif cell wall-anchored protein